MCQLPSELLNMERMVTYHLSQEDHSVVAEKNVPNYSYTNIHKAVIFDSNPEDA